MEEFHQEIQTITNYPMKEFLVPFLRVSCNMIVCIQNVSANEFGFDVLIGKTF